ncbi:MAG: hypothetical protein WCL00_13195, partial [Bacteroidota bacterium]
AGECVSLACLYAAALFIVAETPLDKIFLIGTPLHSQNFILVDEGVLTNNRRIVTRSMWYNGTELSALARRALEHEQVTVVSHCSGYIHAIYPEATIDPVAYKSFHDHLVKFLETKVQYEVFINFLRDYSKYQKLFQVSYSCRGFMKYILLEKAFSYEHDSKSRLGEKNGRKLLCEMEAEDFYLQPIDARFILDADDELFKESILTDFLHKIEEKFPKLCENEPFITDLKKFMHTVPKLPSTNKTFLSSPHFTISPTQTREEIIEYLSEIRHQAPGTRHYNETSSQQPVTNIADLAFNAGRYMDSCDWTPFLKAVFERNPVSVLSFNNMDQEEVYHILNQWPNESIYDGNRLALPDEVVNFKRGDGIEKALVFLNVMKAKEKSVEFHLHAMGKEVIIFMHRKKYIFLSEKSTKMIPSINSEIFM